MALEMNFCSNQEKGPEFFKNNFNLSIYLFMTVLGLCCCTGFSLLLASGGASLVVVLCRVLIEVASLVVEHGLQAWGLQ